MIAWIVGGSVALVLVIAVIAVLAFRSFDKAMVSGLLKKADDIALQAEGEQDWERMVFLLRKAAEKGSHEAEYKLGANARNLLLGLRPLREPVARPEGGEKGVDDIGSGFVMDDYRMRKEIAFRGPSTRNPTS